MVNPGKVRLLKALQLGEEVMRQTGRTSHMVDMAVRHIAETREQVLIVASTEAQAKRLAEQVEEQAREMLGLHEFPAVVGVSTARIASGLELAAREKAQLFEGVAIFEDHESFFRRALQAVENL